MEDVQIMSFCLITCTDCFPKGMSFLFCQHLQSLILSQGLVFFALTYAIV